MNNILNIILCIFISACMISLILEEVRTGINNIKKELIQNVHTGYDKFIYILSRVFFGKDNC